MLTRFILQFEKFEDDGCLPKWTAETALKHWLNVNVINSVHL